MDHEDHFYGSVSPQGLIRENIQRVRPGRKIRPLFLFRVTFTPDNEATKILGVSIVTIRDNASGKRKSKRFNFRWVKDES